MENNLALESIENCKEQLDRIFHLIEGIGHTAPMIPFLTNYAIIKACGTIEFCFKTIICDLHAGSSPQISNYIDNTLRNSSMNPSFDNIHKTLKKFDDSWNIEFKNKLKERPNYQRLKSSLDSLNNARNSFAHGIDQTASFEDIKRYFEDALEVLEVLDRVTQKDDLL